MSFPSRSAFFTEMRLGSPAPSGRGGMAATYLIPVAIAAMNGRAITGMNPFDHAMPAGYFEVAVGFNSDTPHIGTDMRPFGDHCPHHIPGLETPMTFAALTMPDGKPSLIYPTHLPISMPVGSDEQGHDTPDQDRLWSTRS